MTNVNQVAVVTGATGGIGNATCLKLLDDGFALVAQYRSQPDLALALQAHAEAMGASCALVSADLAVSEGVDAVVAAVDDALGNWSDSQLVALVNNAGKLLGPSFLDATVADFDSYFAVNTRAPFFLSQQLCTRMTNGGSIVNVSSAGAHFSSPGDIVYAMSKAAIESLTFNMAEAVASKGIRVNSVVPGFTDNGHEAFQLPEVHAYMSSFAVLGDVSRPETVAEAISFLLSDRSARTTGAILDVSGGSLLGARGAREHGLRALIPELAQSASNGG